MTSVKSKRFIELIDPDGGVGAVISVGVDGFAQIHVSLLREILDAGNYEYEVTA